VAWRVEVAHSQLLRHQRVVRSFENPRESTGGWLQIACLAAVLEGRGRTSSNPAAMTSRAIAALLEQGA
jgi:hypothetical protein